MTEFEENQRPDNMFIKTYINDFESIYKKVKVFKIEMPDIIRANRLMKRAYFEKSKLYLLFSASYRMTFCIAEV